MRKMLITVSVVVILMLAVSGAVFATGGYGPCHDSCPKVELTEEELASFNEVIEDYREEMQELRGDPEAREQRMELREEKLEKLLDLAPDRLADRFGNFNEKGNSNRNFGAEKGSGNGAQRGPGR